MEDLSGHWESFEKSIGQAFYLAQDANGCMVEHTKQLTKSMYDLGREVNSNWSKSRIEKPGERPLFQQRTDIINACKELQKALKSLTDIAEIRNINDKEMQLKELVGHRQESTTKVVNPSGAEIDAEVPVLFDASNEIKEEPVEIKKEPVEIKDEPFDDFSEIKQEDPLEEPIADMFCPSTGISPSMGVDCSDATKHQNLNSQSSKSKIFCPSNGTSRPINTMNLGFNEDMNSERMEDSVDLSMNGPSTISMQCYLCDKTTTDFNLTPVSVMERSEFLRNLHTGTIFEQDRLAELKENIYRAPICVDHFMGLRHCFLCKKYINRYRVTPFGGQPRLVFLSSIITDSKCDRDRVDALKISNEVPFFCVSHIKQRVPANKTGTVYRKGVQLQKLSASRCNRFEPSCDLCCKPTPPFCCTPQHPSLAQDFYSRLVLTPGQRNIVQMFRHRGKMLTVCKTHVKAPLAKSSRLDQLKDTSGMIELRKEAAQVTVPEQHPSTLIKDEVKEEEMEEEQPGLS